MPGTHHLTGSCHCGAIRVALTLTKPPAEIEVRACRCGFCTRHGSMTVSDPAGAVVIEAKPDALGRYQFGTKTAESLLCRVCGMYIGALLTEGEHSWSIVNTRGLAMRELADRTPTPMVYEHETPEARIARRKAKWTPTVVRSWS
jgi:hypothetical protein